MTTDNRQVMVTITHVRKLYMCSAGARRWCARHGMDWGEFLRDGVSTERLRASGDPMALALADLAESEAR